MRLMPDPEFMKAVKDLRRMASVFDQEPVKERTVSEPKQRGPEASFSGEKTS